MEEYVYYNGKCGKWGEISIPLSDRSIFFGDAVYDAALGASGKIYLGDLHNERFFGNIRALGLTLGMSEENFSSLLNAVARESGFKKFFIYYQLSGYLDERLHAPRCKSRSNLLITVKPFEPMVKELSLISCSDRRHRMCHIKTTNLLGAILASEEAEALGADEAVFERGGFVTECAHSNISIIKGGELITHPKSEYLLPGIMRGELIRVAKEIGIEVRERPFSLSELYSADDAIVTSTSKIAMRVKELNSVPISCGNHEIADEIIGILRNDFTDFCSI